MKARHSTFASRALAALLLTAGLVVCAPADAQHRAQPQQQVNAYLLLGFGGEASVDPGGAEADLDASIGFGLRYQAPLTDFFAVGGLFELRSFETDLGTDRQPVFDFDVFFKTGWLVSLGRSNFEVYGLIPIGLSIAPEDEAFTGQDDTGLGFNLGLLAGAQWLIQGRFGVFVEAGWRRHQIFSETSAGDFDVTANQFAMNVGASYAL